MPDDGLFEWPKWLGPVAKKLMRIAGVLIVVTLGFFLVLLAVGVAMNVIAPHRDTTVPMVGVILVILGAIGLVLSRRARRS